MSLLKEEGVGGEFRLIVANPIAQQRFVRPQRGAVGESPEARHPALIEGDDQMSVADLPFDAAGESLAWLKEETEQNTRIGSGLLPLNIPIFEYRISFFPLGLQVVPFGLPGESKLLQQEILKAKSWCNPVTIGL